eukprot:12278120-Ditylum_brightwellii.AAC.2
MEYMSTCSQQAMEEMHDTLMQDMTPVMKIMTDNYVNMVIATSYQQQQLSTHQPEITCSAPMSIPKKPTL